MNSVGVPSAGSTAKASGAGLWATSAPRMLNVQAIEFGLGEHGGVGLLLGDRRLETRDLVGRGLAGEFQRCSDTAPSGGAGRSRHSPSIGFAATATSSAPAARQVSAKRRAPLMVVSHGS